MLYEMVKIEKENELVRMEKYTRVTDILFPFSGIRNIDPNILKRAAERGTKVHNICDAIISNPYMGMPPLEDEMKGYIDSFLAWKGEKEFIEKPSRFYSEDHLITGECDAVYKSSDGLVLVDFKTSASEGNTWFLQGSAYSYLANKQGYEIKKIEFVKLDKKGKVAKVFEYKEDFTLFLKCLEIYRKFFKNVKEENYLDYI